CRSGMAVSENGRKVFSQDFEPLPDVEIGVMEGDALVCSQRGFVNDRRYHEAELSRGREQTGDRSQRSTRLMNVLQHVGADDEIEPAEILGQVLCIRHPEGQPWPVAVAPPRERDRARIEIDADDLAGSGREQVIRAISGPASQIESSAALDPGAKEPVDRQ